MNVCDVSSLSVYHVGDEGALERFVGERERVNGVGRGDGAVPILLGSHTAM